MQVRALLFRCLLPQQVLPSILIGPGLPALSFVFAYQSGGPKPDELGSGGANSWLATLCCRKRIA